MPEFIRNSSAVNKDEILGNNLPVQDSKLGTRVAGSDSNLIDPNPDFRFGFKEYDGFKISDTRQTPTMKSTILDNDYPQVPRNDSYIYDGSSIHSPKDLDTAGSDYQTMLMTDPAGITDFEGTILCWYSLEFIRDRVNFAGFINPVGDVFCIAESKENVTSSSPGQRVYLSLIVFNAMFQLNLTENINSGYSAGITYAQNVIPSHEGTYLFAVDTRTGMFSINGEKLFKAPPFTLWGNIRFFFISRFLISNITGAKVHSIYGYRDKSFSNNQLSQYAKSGMGLSRERILL